MQYIIKEYIRQVPQGSWLWQNRGASSLVAYPAILGAMPHLNSKQIKEFRRQYGALGVTPKSKYYLFSHDRKDAEEFARDLNAELMPLYGGDRGPWLTKT
jgi:hypothetical protein